MYFVEPQEGHLLPPHDLQYFSPQPLHLYTGKKLLENAFSAFLPQLGQLE
jgi:hypothetical protein